MAGMHRSPEHTEDPTAKGWNPRGLLVEELADITEVVSALMALHDIGQQEVLEARRKSNGPI
jgi:hypothetical protein